LDAVSVKHNIPQTPPPELYNLVVIPQGSASVLALALALAFAAALAVALAFLVVIPQGSASVLALAFAFLAVIPSAARNLLLARAASARSKLKLRTISYQTEYRSPQEKTCPT